MNLNQHDDLNTEEIIYNLAERKIGTFDKSKVTECILLKESKT